MSFHHLIRKCVLAPRSQICQFTHQKPVLQCLFAKTSADSHHETGYQRIQEYHHKSNISRTGTSRSHPYHLNGDAEQLLTMLTMKNTQPSMKFSTSAFYCSNKLSDRGIKKEETTIQKIYKSMSRVKAIILGGSVTFLFGYMWIHRYQARANLNSALREHELAQKELALLLDMSKAVKFTENTVTEPVIDDFIAMIPPENESDKSYPLGERIVFNPEDDKY